MIAPNNLPLAKPTEEVGNTHRLMAVALQQGDSVESLAQKFDLTVEQVDAIVETQAFAEILSDVQASLNVPLEERFAAAAEIAYRQKLKLLVSDCKPELKDRIASDLIDRAVGRPTQSMEVKSFNVVADVRDLEELRKRRTAIEEKLAAIKDKRDKLSVIQNA